MRVYVVSRNGIPDECYSSLRGACRYIGVDYYSTRRLLMCGRRVVVREYRITSLEVIKVRGRGRY